jgi:hypothetical protein
MPDLRTDHEAAGSIVGRHHCQLAPPGLQQGVHHIQMPILRSDPKAAYSIIRGQHRQPSCALIHRL